MNHSDDVSIRRFRESDLCQLVRLISETIGISYAVYPPRAVQFFKDFHSEKKIADRSKTGQPLSSRRMGNWWLPGVWSVAKYSPCLFIQDCKKAVAERRS